MCMSHAGTVFHSFIVYSFVLSYFTCVVTIQILSIQRQCRPILQTVEHSDFTEVLLPSLLKSLLRNPEGVLEGIVYLMFLHIVHF